MWRDHRTPPGMPQLRYLPGSDRVAYRRGLSHTSRSMNRIAVDAMGGDLAPSSVVEGAVLASKELDVEVILVGQEDDIRRELGKHSTEGSSIRVVHASRTVSMKESPSSSIKKRETSMKVAFELVKMGEAQGVVSAGNSGAMMAIGMFVLGTLPYVERPAILLYLPFVPTKGPVLIDGGANAECKPRHLAQFALMGSVYAEHVLEIDRPRVGVLSNGEEEGKGTDLTRATIELLQMTPLNSIGYIEGRDITGGQVDVVTCDGFTGNVVLKTMEGVASWVVGILKEALMQSHLSRLGLLMSRRSLRRAFNRMDYAEVGGAPLLGLDGVAIIAHGGSSPKAIKNAIRVANETVSHDVNRHIVEMLEGLDNIQDGRGQKLSRKVWNQIRSKIDTLSEKPVMEKEGKETRSGRKE